MTKIDRFISRKRVNHHHSTCENIGTNALPIAVNLNLQLVNLKLEKSAPFKTGAQVFTLTELFFDNHAVQRCTYVRKREAILCTSIIG